MCIRDRLIAISGFSQEMTSDGTQPIILNSLPLASQHCVNSTYIVWHLLESKRTKKMDLKREVEFIKSQQLSMSQTNILTAYAYAIDKMESKDIQPTLMTNGFLTTCLLNAYTK